MGKIVRNVCRIALRGGAALLLALAVVVWGGAASWAAGLITTTSGWSLTFNSGLTAGDRLIPIYGITIGHPTSPGTVVTTFYCAKADGSGEVIPSGGGSSTNPGAVTSHNKPVGAGLDCGAGKGLSRIVVSVSGTTKLEWSAFADDAPGSGSCSPSPFLEVRAQYSYGDLTVYVNWDGDRPLRGWKVYSPIPSGSAVNSGGTIPSDREDDWEAGWYGGTITPTTYTNSGGFRLVARDADGCRYDVSGPVSSTDVNPPQADGSGGGGGGDCGLFDPLGCLSDVIVWAFVPSEGYWDSLWAEVAVAGDHWPFGLVADLTLVTDAMDPSETCKATPTIPECWPDWEFGGVALVPYSDPMSVWLRDHRGYLALGIYLVVGIGLGMRIFWALVPVVGGGGKGGSDGD